jgi:hypothetical protein
MKSLLFMMSCPDGITIVGLLGEAWCTAWRTARANAIVIALRQGKARYDLSVRPAAGGEPGMKPPMPRIYAIVALPGRKGESPYFGLFDFYLMPLFCPTGQARLHPPVNAPSPRPTVHGVVLQISNAACRIAHEKARPRERGRAIQSCGLLDDQPRVRERIMKLS